MNEGFDYEGLGTVLVIIFSGLGTLFAAWVAFKALPQVHTLVNRNFTEQQVKIDAQLQELAALRTQNERSLSAMQAAANVVSAERLADAKASPAPHEVAPVQRMAETLAEVQEDVVIVKEDVAVVKDEVTTPRRPELREGER